MQDILAEKLVEILMNVFGNENSTKEFLIKCWESQLTKPFRVERNVQGVPGLYHKEGETTRVCVKVANLRKIYGPNITFEQWLKDQNNYYCGRSGRIFIDKEIFHYPGSKWANPYVLKKYSLEESIRLYKEYITEKIEKNPDYFNLHELRGKNLGCWCNPNDKCHVDILLDLLEE